MAWAAAEEDGHTLGASVHENLGDHAGNEELDQAIGETEAGPVMAVLHNVESIAVEVNLLVEVHLVEGLHGDLVLAAVLELVLGVLEGEVVLHRTTGKLGLLILARREVGMDQPEAGKQGDGGEEGKEDGGLETTADLP